VNYTSFLTASRATTALLDNSKTLDLTASVSGATTYYVKGTFNFAANDANPLLSQIFRPGVTGAAGSWFANDITVAAIPEPAVAFLVLLGGIIMLGVRNRRVNINRIQL
jgi:hypothetical protein